VEILFNPERGRDRERRGAPRVPATGRIQLSFEDPDPTVVEGELVESSATGFRVVHDSKSVSPGVEVEYRHKGTNGQARVIWTHVLNERRVSGFLIL
jgi:hypothetical protein